MEVINIDGVQMEYTGDNPSQVPGRGWLYNFKIKSRTTATNLKRLVGKQYQGCKILGLGMNGVGEDQTGKVVSFMFPKILNMKK